MTSISDIKHKLQGIASNLERLTKNLTARPQVSALQAPEISNNVPAEVVSSHQVQSISLHSTSPAYPSLSELDSLLDVFYEKSNTVKPPELNAITPFIRNLITDMKSVIQFSYTAKKPTPTQLQQLRRIIVDKLKNLRQLDKNRAIQHQVTAVYELSDAVLWILTDQAPAEHVKNAIDAADYKAYKFKKEKNQEQNQWYASLVTALSYLQKYIKEYFPTGLNFNNANGGDNYEPLYAALNENRHFFSQDHGQSVAAVSATQSTSATKSGQQKDEEVYFPTQQFFAHLQQSLESAQKTGIAELVEIAEIVEKTFRKMHVVIQASRKYKQPDGQSLKDLNQALSDTCARFNDIKNVASCKNHVPTFQTGLNAAFWVFSPVDAKGFVEGSLETSQNFSFKFTKEKIPEQNDFYKHFNTALRDLLAYVKQYYPISLEWNNASGSSDYTPLLQQLGSTSAQVAPPTLVQIAPAEGAPAPPPPLFFLLEQNKDLIEQMNNSQTASTSTSAVSSESGAKAALFAALNTGDGVTSHLRKVDKKKLEEDRKNAAPLQPKSSATANNAKAQTVAAPKEPRKHFDQRSWHIENYQNETITFEEHEVIERQHGIFVENCKSTIVRIESKCNSIILNKCEKVTLVFNAVISNVEVLNSKNVKIISQENVPSVIIDKCMQTHVTLMKNKDSDIMTCNSTETNVTYALNEEELARDTCLPEQFITKWSEEENRFVTTIHSNNW